MKNLDGLLVLYDANPIGWDILLAFIAITAIAYYLPSRFEFHQDGWAAFIPRGRTKMLKKARRDFVYAQAIYDFVHCVEERVFSGEFSRREAQELYREAKKAFPVKQLFPHPELLKEDIKRRMASGIHQPVPLPAKEVPPKKKHMFDKKPT